MTLAGNVFRLGLLVLLANAAAAQAQQWGTVKGRVVFDGDVPERKQIQPFLPCSMEIEKACLKDGPILSDELVVDPKTKGVTRHVAIISEGGNWGNDPGAATVMIDMAKKQAAEAEAQYEAHQRNVQQQQNSKLPSLNQIRGQPTPKPSPLITLPPR